MQYFTIDNNILDKLISSHDGDMALLYMHILKNGGFNGERAATELCRTMNEISSAKEKLDRVCSLPAAPAKKPDNVLPPPDELPQYSQEEIARRAAGSEEFSAIVGEAQNVMGHILSSEELRTVFGIYDYLRLPADVIFMLLNYCLERCVERYGEQRRPTARMIEKEAYYWVNREITTFEQADEYIRSRKEKDSVVGRIKYLLGIRDRALTATESKFVDEWAGMGFDEDVIAAALDRTVINTGKLSWSYMNKILQAWNSEGLHTLGEIEAAYPSRKTAQAAPAASSIDLDKLDKIFN